MICSKKNQHQGPMYVQTHTKAIKNPTKTKYYLHNPWSKPVGSQMGSDFWWKEDLEGFPSVHIFAWNSWTNGKLSSPMCMTPPHNFLSIFIFNKAAAIHRVGHSLFWLSKKESFIYSKSQMSILSYNFLNKLNLCPMLLFKFQGTWFYPVD